MLKVRNFQFMSILCVVVFLLPSAIRARFISVDPLAAKYPSVSPYVYASNNPIAIVDPDGRGPVSAAVRAARKALSHRLLKTARQKAVRRAWAIERKLLGSGGETSMKLAVKEKDELLRTGKIAGWEGHHINSATVDNLELAMDPNNIRFVKGRKAHLELHDGNWKNQTSGPLMDRLSKLGGPALLAFFLAYDAKLQELLSDCDICSDDDAWHSYINPWNALLENVALTYGYTAARQASEEDNSDDSDPLAPYSAENANPPEH